VQGVAAVPWCLINVAPRRLTRQARHGFLVRRNRVRHPIKDLLHRAQAHGHVQH
jgi:hypothetical protein